MMFQVYGRMSSNSVQKVVWLLDALGIPYQQHDYGGTYGGTRTPEYLMRNPHGTIPTVFDGEVTLWESNTIMRYIANQYPSPLYPAGLAARAHVEKWMDWQIGTLNPAFRPLYVSLVRDGKTMNDSVDKHQAAAGQFALLENFVGDQCYLTGANFTLADIAIGPMLYRWFKLGLDQSDMPRLAALLARYMSMPAFISTVSRELA